MRLIVVIFALFVSSGIFSQISQPRCFDYDGGGNRIERNLCAVLVKSDNPEDLFVLDRIEQELDSKLLTNYEDMSDLIVYPNPTAGYFMIKESYSAEARLYIFDMAGNTIRSFGYVPGAVDLSGFPVGIYVLVVKDGDRTGVVKIVKNK